MIITPVLYHGFNEDRLLNQVYHSRRLMVLHHPFSSVQAGVAPSEHGSAAPTGFSPESAGAPGGTSCQDLTTSGMYRIIKNHQTMEGAATVHTECAALSSISPFPFWYTRPIFVHSDIADHQQTADAS